MTRNRVDERYSSVVDIPQLSGRLDEVTAYAVRALAANVTLSPEEVRRERARVVEEHRRQHAAERARRKAAAEQLAADVAAAIRKG